MPWGLKPIPIENTVPEITEMCDVCGKDIPTSQVIRTSFYSKTGIRFVIRHHCNCNPIPYAMAILK